MGESEAEEVEEIEPEPLLCVTCGADDVVPVIWGFGRENEAPVLMRSLNLCETCRDYAGRVILGGELKVAKRTGRELRAYLRKLVDATTDFLDAADKVYEKSSATPDRGRAIAKLMNKLNLARDVARRFGLGGK